MRSFKKKKKDHVIRLGDKSDVNILPTALATWNSVIRHRHHPRDAVRAAPMRTQA
jgi:hypothetical protein